MKLIEFLNQSSLVLPNGRLGDTSSKLIFRQKSGSSIVDTIVLYLGTYIIRYNNLTQFGIQTTLKSKCLRS